MKLRKQNVSNFASSKAVILKNVRLTWGDIYKPGEGMNGGAPKFKASALFEADSDAAKVGKAALLAAATELWGANAINVVKAMGANSKAIRNGDDKLMDDGSVRPEYAGMLYISCSNKMKPQVVGPRMHDGKFVTIGEDGHGYVNGVDVTDQLGYELTPPYRGCYVNLKVQFVAGKSFKAGNGEMLPNQVYAKLEALQFVRDGEAFGAGPTSAEGFGEEEVAPADADGSELF